MKISNFLILIICIIFTSCYSVNKMNKQVIKGYNTYPIDFKEIIVKLLPVQTKDSISIETRYISGDTIVKSIYIKADCDTVKPDSSGKKIVYLEEKEKTIHDTIYKEKVEYTTIKDTRELDVLSNKYNEANIKIAEKDNTIVIMTWTLSIIGLIIVGYFLIKKFSFFKKLI